MPASDERPMVETGSASTVAELKRNYELLQERLSTYEARAEAELRNQQAVQEFQLQTFTTEARCQVMLDNHDAHNEVVLTEIKQRHDALVHVEEILRGRRTAEAELVQRAQCDFNSLRGIHAEDLDELRQQAAEEVQSAEIVVSIQLTIYWETSLVRGRSGRGGKYTVATNDATLKDLASNMPSLP